MRVEENDHFLILRFTAQYLHIIKIYFEKNLSINFPLSAILWLPTVHGTTGGSHDTLECVANTLRTTALLLKCFPMRQLSDLGVTCMRLFSASYALHAPPISFLSIQSPE